MCKLFELFSKIQIINFSQKISQKDVEIDQFNIFYLDVQKGMAELSRHLVYIFPGPIQTEFSVIFSQKFGELFAYEHMQQLETLRIVGGIMLKNLLEQVFGNLKIQKKLVVEPDTDDEYVIEQVRTFSMFQMSL